MGKEILPATLRELVVAAYDVSTDHEKAWISDSVIAFMANAGLGPDSRDRFGTETSDTVQSCLLVAAMLSPQIAEYMRELEVREYAVHEEEAASGPGPWMCPDAFKGITHAPHAVPMGTGYGSHWCDGCNPRPHSFDPSNHQDGRTVCSCACHERATLGIPSRLDKCSLCGWGQFNAAEHAYQHACRLANAHMDTHSDQQRHDDCSECVGLFGNRDRLRALARPAPAEHQPWKEYMDALTELYEHTTKDSGMAPCWSGEGAACSTCDTIKKKIRDLLRENMGKDVNHNATKLEEL